MDAVEVTRADAPLLLSFPHVGTLLTPDLTTRLTPVGRTLIDTDWDVDQLYACAGELGISTIRPEYSRYVVDLNRDPDDVPLYPGARTSTVCPTETFAGEALYAPGDQPAREEIAARLAAYWQPYHDALAAQIKRIRARHGYAIVLDGHSIWGRVPLLFDGELPEVNVGTNGGTSCDPAVTAAVTGALLPVYPSLVVDARFKGGYITRHYGTPARNVHAIQIELNQSTYLADGSRTEHDAAKVARLSAALRDVCEALLAWTPATRGPVAVT